MSLDFNQALIGQKLVIIGVLILIYAFNMSVSMDGADVVNMHLLSDRQNYTILGSIIFLAGIILYATSMVNGKQDHAGKNKIDVDETVSYTKATNVASEKIKNAADKIKHFLSNRHQSDIFILISILLAIISLFTPWSRFESVEYKQYMSFYMYINKTDLLIITLPFIYPCLMLINRQQLYRKYAITCSVLLIIWLCRHIIDRIFSVSQLTQYGDITISIGPWIAFVAALLYFRGAMLIPRDLNYDEKNNLNLKTILVNKPRSELFIIWSLMLVIASLVGWWAAFVYSGNGYLLTFSHCTIITVFSYPLMYLMYRKEMNQKYAIISSVLLIIVMAFHLGANNSMAIISMLLTMSASVLNIIGVFQIRNDIGQAIT